MPDRTERGTLNHLIETCRDGERGFRYAANHVVTADVKELFLEVAGQREHDPGLHPLGHAAGPLADEPADHGRLLEIAVIGIEDDGLALVKPHQQFCT